MPYCNVLPQRIADGLGDASQVSHSIEPAPGFVTGTAIAFSGHGGHMVDADGTVKGCADEVLKTLDLDARESMDKINYGRFIRKGWELTV